MCGSRRVTARWQLRSTLSQLHWRDRYSYPIRIEERASASTRSSAHAGVPGDSAGDLRRGAESEIAKVLVLAPLSGRVCPNITMPMLLENFTTSESDNDEALCMSVIVRPSSSSFPLCVSMMSSGFALPREQRRAYKQLSVEPGSNGSVIKCWRPRPRRCADWRARASPVWGFITTMSPPLA